MGGAATSSSIQIQYRANGPVGDEELFHVERMCRSSQQLAEFAYYFASCERGLRVFSGRGAFRGRKASDGPPEL
jgi:hypothetical protein